MKSLAFLIRSAQQVLQITGLGEVVFPGFPAHLPVMSAEPDAGVGFTAALM